MAAADPMVAASFPVILSFFCAGVPSHAGGLELLAALGLDHGDVASFRYRGMGWPGRATATLRDGSERSMSYHDSWGGILSRHVQLRCKICPDGIGMTADIVCADAWECDDAGYPIFAEAPGVSLIVARTALGAQIVAAAKATTINATRPADPPIHLRATAGAQARPAAGASLPGHALADARLADSAVDEP